jgi:thiamine-monophosphate kinase
VAGERRLTAGLARFFRADPARVPLGIGDDAAVVRHAGRLGVVACDPVIEGVHFTRSTPLRDVGRKAVNRNLSDIAAMGAVADHLLVAAILPAWVEAPQRRQLFGGIRAAADRAGCLVVGGDIAATPGPLTVVVTVLGHPGPRVLTRSAARAGDALHVTGPLGGAQRDRHHLRFAPRLEAGVWLAGQRGVAAAMDVSDGLLLDLWTMLRASAVPGAVLDAAAIPVRAAARRAAGGDREAALAAALTDGEDHELLFTVRAGARLGPGGPLPAVGRRPIGTLVDRPGLWLRGAGGALTRLQPGGYEHDVR